MNRNTLDNIFSRKLLVYFVLATLVLSSCSTTSINSQSISEDSFVMSIAYYNDNGDALGHMVNGEKILLLFPSIKGQIFGIPRRPILTEVTVSDNEPFTVELPDLPGKESAMMVDSEWTTGLTITPAQTQMLRVATMAFDKETRKPFAAGSLINPESGDNLLLMYFSMPCTISGTVETEGLQYQHQIEIDRAGWHWIAGTQPSAGVKVEFAITVDGMLAL